MKTLLAIGIALVLYPIGYTSAAPVSFAGWMGASVNYLVGGGPNETTTKKVWLAFSADSVSGPLTLDAFELHDTIRGPQPNYQLITLDEIGYIIPPQTIAMTTLVGDRRYGSAEDAGGHDIQVQFRGRSNNGWDIGFHGYAPFQFADGRLLEFVTAGKNVPEPATWGLVVLAITGGVAWRRRCAIGRR